MSLFKQMERYELDIKADLEEFMHKEHEDGSYSSVGAMNVTYKRSLMAGKYGVFTIKFADYSGMRCMEAKIKTPSGEWVEGEIEEITLAIDGSWELHDFLEACKMIVTTEELHSKLT